MSDIEDEFAACLDRLDDACFLRFAQFGGDVPMSVEKGAAGITG